MYGIPKGKILGPNKLRHPMIFLTDLSSDESMRPRSPSEVPEVCIMRCIDRRMCLRTAARATGNFPTRNQNFATINVKFSNHMKQGSHERVGRRQTLRYLSQPHAGIVFSKRTFSPSVHSLRSYQPGSPHHGYCKTVGMRW